MMEFFGFCGMVFALAVNICVAVFFYGRLTETVANLNKMIAKIERKLDDADLVHKEVFSRVDQVEHRLDVHETACAMRHGVERA